MKYIVFDIETTGLTPLNCRIVSIGLKSKNDEKILISENKELIEINKKYLNLKKLVLDENNPSLEDKLKTIFDEKEQLELLEEKKIINQFWDYVKAHKKKYGAICLIGFNSVSFDMHFIKIRSIHHNLPIFSLKKYEEHIDLFYVLTPYRGKYAKLDDYCNLFGIPKEYEKSGEAVPEAWEQKDFELIKQHNLDDIRRTWKLFHVLKDNNMIESEIDLRV